MHPGTITLAKRRSRSLSHAVAYTAEWLETRRLLSVAKNSAGWSVIHQDSGGQKIYVDNTAGTDANHEALNSDSYDGLFSTHVDGTSHGPVQTIAHARTLIHDGHDDWLLLKAGDTFNEPLGPWHYHGPSASDPMVISYYGFYNNGQTYYDQSNYPDQSQRILNLPHRPIIHSSLTDGLMLTSGASNLVVDGLQFFPEGSSNYDGTNSIGVTGLRAQVTGHDFLIEDCLFDGYKDEVVVGNPDTPVTNFTIRRSEILDSYNTSGAHAQGLYASGSTVNLTVEDNVFDHNGWRAAKHTDGTNISDGKEHPEDKVVFNHDMYINTGATGTLIQNNVITRGSLRGTLLRAGGTVLNNLYDQNAVAIQVGNTTSDVEGNVILEGVDLPSLASGVGIDVAFSMPQVTVKNNIIAHDQSAYEYNLSGINLNGGTHKADVEDNIVYDWRRTLIAGVSGSGNTIAHNVLEDFDATSGHHPLITYSGSGTTSFGDNSYFAPSAVNSTAFQDGSAKMSFGTWTTSSTHGQSDNTSSYGTLEPYIDPNRDMGTYNATLNKPGDFNSWITAQRVQTREGNSSYSPWYQLTGDGSPAPYTATAEIAHIKDGFTTQSDTASLQTVNVVATDPNASELGLDPGTFTLTRTVTDPAQLLAPLTVYLSVDGSATLGSDYTFNQNVTAVTFPGIITNSTTQTLTPSIIVNPLADNLIEGDETVKIIIAADQNFIPLYTTGLNPSATVTIADSVSTVNVQASTPSALIDGLVPGDFSLTRSGPTDSAMTVNVLWSGEAVFGTDYTITSADGSTFTNPGTGAPDTITFPVGASTIDLSINPIDTGVLHGGVGGIDPDTGLPAPGTQDVGLTILTSNTVAYTPGVSAGATVTIYDPAASPGDGGGDGGGGGGGGGLTNPPPTGHGLYEDYINTQDNFIPPSQFNNDPYTEANGIDYVNQDIQNGTYGSVSFSQGDSRPGFDFTTGSTGHSAVATSHYSALWTGQMQPSFNETYTMYVTLDGDASARLWVQGDSGAWHLIASTNDTDPTKTNYSQSDYFTHKLGDANDDAIVNTSDFTAMAANFNKSGQKWANGDFNGDGVVNALDFNVLATNFGTSDPRPSTHTISGTVGFFAAGERYSVVLEYSNKVSRASIRVLWSSNSQNKQEVPLDRLYQSSVATSPSLGNTVSGASLFSTLPIDGQDQIDGVIG